jgi:hypothetical protein
MGERLLLMLLSGVVGLIIGLFGPGLFPPAQQVVDTEQAWLYPDSPTPVSTEVPLVLSRPTIAQTAVPPTLKPFTAPTAPPQPPTPVSVTVPGANAPKPVPVSEPNPEPEPSGPPPAHTFIIRLQGGGAMTVVANDEDAARNNVRSQGGTPVD